MLYDCWTHQCVTNVTNVTNVRMSVSGELMREHQGLRWRARERMARVKNGSLTCRISRTASAGGSTIPLQYAGPLFPAVREPLESR